VVYVCSSVRGSAILLDAIRFSIQTKTKTKTKMQLTKVLALATVFCVHAEQNLTELIRKPGVDAFSDVTLTNSGRSKIHLTFNCGKDVHENSLIVESSQIWSPLNVQVQTLGKPGLVLEVDNTTKDSKVTLNVTACPHQQISVSGRNTTMVVNSGASLYWTKHKVTCSNAGDQYPCALCGVQVQNHGNLHFHDKVNLNHIHSSKDGRITMNDQTYENIDCDFFSSKDGEHCK